MRFVRRPLLGLMIFCLAGTWAGLVLPFAPGWTLSGAVLLYLVALLTHRRAGSDAAGQGAWPALSTVATHACVAAVACLAASTSASRRPGLCLPPAGERVETIGVVDADPDVRPTGQRVVWNFPLRAETLTWTGHGELPAGRWVPIRLHGGERWEGPRYGEKWRVSGTVGPFSSGGAAFGLRGLCLRTGISRAWRVSEGHGWRLADACFRMRQRCADYLRLGIEDCPEVAGLIRALLLGYRGELSPRIQNLAIQSGTLHIFAISGLHVVVIAGVAAFVLRALRIPSTRWIWFLAPVLAAYTFATGMKASAVRALVMASFFWAAPALGRKPDAPSALALAAVVIVAVAPAQLFDVGFVYSFASVAGLMALCPVFYAPFRRLAARDPAAVLPEPKLLALAKAAGRYVGSLWAVSAAAFLTSLPITAFCFEREATFAVFSNLLVVPVSCLMVFAACLSLLLGPCAGWFAAVFNSANVALTAALVRFLDVMTSLPGAAPDVPRPAVWQIAAWYATLAWMAVALRPKEMDASRAG
jgi:ComEC/Rec2-related protein